MTGIFGNFPRASFAEVEFPYTTLSIKSSLRHHVHVYLHRPGGEIESLGRGLYEFKFAVPLHTTDRAFPFAYPTLMNTLVSLYESENTYRLVVPNMGPMQAKIIDFARMLSARVTSGETADLTLLEDSTEAFSAQTYFTNQAAAILPQVTAIARKAASYDLPLSLFDSIVAAANEVNAAIDKAELQSAIFAAKVLKLTNACETLAGLHLLQRASNFAVLDLVHDLWATAQNIRADVKNKSRTVETTTVDRLCTVIDLSMDLYGGTDQTSELLQVNDFNDPMAIRPGTVVNYYVA